VRAVSKKIWSHWGRVGGFEEERAVEILRGLNDLEI